MQLFPRRGAWLALTALLPLSALAGCVAEGTDFEAYPFFSIDAAERARQEDTGAVASTTHVTIPILLSAWDKLPRKRIVRGPGGGSIDPESPDAKREKLQVLYPILVYHEEGREHETRLFGGILGSGGLFSTPGPAGRVLGPSDVAADPIVRPTSVFPNAVKGGYFAFPFLGYDSEHLDPRDPEERTKRDFGILPLFMGGDWPERGGYLAVAPFGGITYGFLGKDEMHWYGFPYPIYLYSREHVQASRRSHEKDEYIESRHVLWPFVNWIEGAGRSGFRVWPFYAHYRREDKFGEEAYDRHWIMWPIVSWERNAGLSYDEATDTYVKGPTEELMVFPFFGKIDGPDRYDRTVLWPFFRYYEVPSTDFWELRAPFPVFTIHHGSDPALLKKGEYAERWRFDVWPIFGYRSRPGYARHFVVWPIERYETRDDAYALDTKIYFLPLVMWHHHTEKVQGSDQLGPDYQRTRIFPFFLYRRSARGDVQLHALAPILWDDPDGFERIYFPFFRLYEYRKTIREEKPERAGYSHRFLLGLASYRSEPEEVGVTKGYSRLSLLFGLFQFRSGGTTPEESERSGLRFFFLPEITWGGAS
ncbi:hypothetical protein HY251_01280 [bacterium]|nr:hypothetical protein [bacterium]